MKNVILYTVLLILVPLTISAQNTEIIKKSINDLTSNPDPKEAITEIFKILSESGEELFPFKADLQNATNQLITRANANFNYYYLALELCNAGLIKIKQENETPTVERHVSIRKTIKQSKDYHNWIWDDENYLNLRSESGVILDLMGHFTGQASLNELRTASSELIDNRLRMFASISLLQRGESVTNDILEAISADDEARENLFTGLKAMNQLRLFPSKFKTQEELSKSNMVNWLLYPTELGRMPNQIKLVKMYSVEYADVGMADFYLWKFNSIHETFKDDGWMVGLSGPFVRSETPTTEAYGYTFSAFTKLNDKSPDEHFEEIIGIIDEWQNNIGK